MLKIIHQLFSWIKSIPNNKNHGSHLKIAKTLSLTHAINNAFEEINSPLKVATDNEHLALPFAFAKVEKGKRFSQIYVTAETKAYLPDYWRDGVCLAHGSFTDLTLMARSLQTWLDSDISASKLEAGYSEIKCSESAKFFDEGSEVEHKWNLLLDEKDQMGLNAFIELAKQDDILGQLFPYTSLYYLCFSRCTGYPYTHDTPVVISIEKNVYQVREMDRETLLGTGNAKEALEIVKRNLPIGIKPAVKGTADDL